MKFQAFSPKRLVSVFAASCILFSGACIGNVQQSHASSDWSEQKAPNYYKVSGKASFDKIPLPGKTIYSKIDYLGRTGKVWACVTYNMTTGERKQIPYGNEPSGWTSNRIVDISLPNGRTYHGYFWNRSHLLADSLGGVPYKKNLITGSRMQNVGANDGKGGMAYTETKARNWLKKHKRGTVLYSAKPVYKSGELVPRTVEVDIKTSDNSINEHVIVYNAAKGYSINYKTGAYRKTSSTVSKPTKPGKVKSLSVKSKKAGKATLSWKKAKNATAYQIKYKKKGSSSWRTLSTTASKMTISKLSSGKKYKFKVRAKNSVDAKTIYGKWSATKTVSIKKNNKTSSSATKKTSVSNVRTVYWTDNGKVYHTDRNCTTLKRSSNVKSGSVKASGKSA